MNPSMKKSAVIALIFLCLVQVGTAQTVTDWAGVWLLNIEGQEKAHAFLAVSQTADKVSVDYYNRAWERQALTEVGLKNGNLVFKSAPRAKTLQFQLAAAAAGKGEGSWSLIHPQAKMGGAIRARRVFAVNKWDPFEGLRAEVSPNQVIDLNKFLLDKAPRGSLQQFVSFWQAEVEPRFFVLIADLLYGKGGDLEPNRSIVLKPVFEVVKKGAYRQLSAQAAGELNRIISEIKQKQAEFYRENPIVLMPAFGGLETDAEFYNRRLYVRIPLDLAARDYPGKSLSSFLAKQQLKLVTYHIFPPSDKRLGIEFIREGLASSLTVSKGFASSPDALFNLPAGTYKTESGNLADCKKRVLADLAKKDSQVVESLLGSHSAESRKGRIAAYRFGEMVWSRFDLKQVARMGPRGLIDLMRQYLKEG